MTNQGKVRKRWVRTWKRIVVAAAVVSFNHSVAVVSVLLSDHELPFTGPTCGPVKRVVRDTGDEDVLHVDSAAKPLDAVVLVHVNLNVVDGCAASNCLKRDDAVKLVFSCEEATSVFNADILECTTVVFEVWALTTAVFSGVTFTLSNATRLVEVRLTVDDKTAPLTANASVVIWGEDDGCVSGAFSFNLCSAGNAEKRYLVPRYLRIQ